jgi:putative redox protein
MTAQTSTHPPIVVTHLGGVSFDTQIRSHHIVVDQPLGVGGDAGPTPLELVGAALASCVALYVKQFCHSRGIPYEGMRVEVRDQRARNPSRVTDFTVEVHLPEEVTGRNATLLEEVARSCPAHNTLVLGAAVQVTIEAGVPAAA